MPSNTVFSGRLRKLGLGRHAALALALATGSAVALGTAMPVPAYAQNSDTSRDFGNAAQDVIEQVNALSSREDLAPLQAQYDNATTNEAREQATAQLLAALATEKAGVEALEAAISTEGDRNVYGQLIYLVGVAARAPVLLAEGLGQQLDSGLVPEDQRQRYGFDAGRFFFGASQFDNAIKYLDVALGINPNDTTAISLKAEAMANAGSVDAGLNYLRDAFRAAKAAGVVPGEAEYKRGIYIAQEQQNLPQMIALSGELADAHPTTSNWFLALDVLRQASRYPDPELLDLFRLMRRTNSYGDELDIKEYVELADKVGLPGEALTVIDSTAGSDLRGDDEEYYAEYRQISEEKANLDRADLDGAKADAEAAGASANLVTGTADAFFSYGDAATAEALYRLAMTKEGVNTDLVATRLAIVLLDQGKADEAKMLLSQVGGARAPLAKLWTVYANSL